MANEFLLSTLSVYFVGSTTPKVFNGEEAFNALRRAAFEKEKVWCVMDGDENGDYSSTCVNMDNVAWWQYNVKKIELDGTGAWTSDDAS